MTTSHDTHLSEACTKQKGNSLKRSQPLRSHRFLGLARDFSTNEVSDGLSGAALRFRPADIAMAIRRVGGGNNVLFFLQSPVLWAEVRSLSKTSFDDFSRGSGEQNNSVKTTGADCAVAAMFLPHPQAAQKLTNQIVRE